MMGQYKYFFIASAIAILFSAGANAADVSGLATTNYVDGAMSGKANDDDVVHKTGDETIYGTKTFDTQPLSKTTTTYANAANNVLVTKGQVEGVGFLKNVSGGAAVDGKFVTQVSKDGSNVVVAMDYVKIPVGSVTEPSSVASVWIE